MNFAQRLTSAMVAIALGLALNLAPASVAYAHSDLQSTSPLAGETVEAGRIDVTLKFNEEILSGEGSGAVISVIGPLEQVATEYSDGCVDAVRGSLVIEGVSLDQPGTYEVNWRVVSADGHPIEGVYEFKVVNTTGYEAAGVGVCENSLLGEPKTTSDNTGGFPNSVPITPEEGLIGGLVVITLMAIGGAFLLRKQERRISEASEREKEQYRGEL
ncbi:MAG: copper resistance protein CopC [Micrococcales bacterium]